MNVDFETLIFLNQVSQRVICDHDAQQWFDRLPVTDKRRTLMTLQEMLQHARVTEIDVSPAVEDCGIKASYTPVAMLRSKKRAFIHQLRQIPHLPEEELIYAFKLFISLYRIADLRRRQNESLPCDHWWHRDLGDPRIIDFIRKHEAELR